MRTYKAVVFDLDGTLLNTLEDLRDSVNAALRQCGMPERTEDEIRRFVGNGVEKLMSLSVPKGQENPLFQQAYAIFKEHYGHHCNDKTDLYPGVKELLADLRDRGCRMAIVTNKYQAGMDILMEQYFQEYLSVAIGETAGRPKKPAPDGVYEALKQLGIPKEEAVYVGDSEVDIATARNAGMDCIAVEWGFRTREEQEAAGGNQFIRVPAELKKYIAKGRKW